MNKVEKKRQKEQYVVEEMIRLYCRKNHWEKGQQMETLCPVCAELADYAKSRSLKCPFMEEKTFCSNCTVHCYKPQMRERIRQVMRFSGPRMLLYHPVLAIWHLISSKREVKKRKKGNGL
ncbi:nitrous oxide-stimulated promoter family protein [Blautia sp. HCP3S3_H10_1]|uniref:nitrous oxide-stimulated promoter family protein n=1 Tax=unclassified Blautia TaxID=2648079 RepID=UPI003F928457|nr:nitrous oxide-stimulated promoter family protein [Clostridia bacterium]